MRLPVDYLPPLPLYPGLVENTMADGQKLGGHAPSDMQPIKQPLYFQPFCGVAGSRPDNQTATLLPGLDVPALAPYCSLCLWFTGDNGRLVHVPRLVLECGCRLITSLIPPNSSLLFRPQWITVGWCWNAVAG